MRWASIVRLRLRSIFSRRSVEHELDDELRYHLEQQIEEEIAVGWGPEEARFRALRSIQDLEQRKEECRDMRGLNVIDNAVQDFRFAIRQLQRAPGFACVAVFVLALGISAATAIFGFAEAGLIKPLPYHDQDRLLAVFNLNNGDARSLVPYLDFADWQRLNHVFRSLDAYALNGSFTLTTGTGAEQVPGTRVSAGFFRTLGVAPILGRDFHDGEDSPAAPYAVVLSYDAWQRRFGGKPDALGRMVTLNGAPHTIVGVLPREFHFAPYSGAQFWGTLRGSDSCEHNRGCWNVIAIARLKDGVSVKTASAEMQSIVKRLRAQYPDSNGYTQGATLVPLRELIIGDVRPVLLVLLAGAGLLLLIACVNVTTLLLARSDQRQREIALRGALGASSSRLFHQFAIEGFALAALGGLCALFFAAAGMRCLMSLMPPEKLASMPYLQGLGLHPLAVVFTCCLALLAAVVFAVIPTVRTALSSVTDGLKEGARGSAGMTWRRLGSNLVIFEVAIAMVLMVGAGLLGKSLYLLLHLNTGFRPDHLATVQTAWPPASYASDQQKTVLADQIMDAIRQLPGVESVGISTAPPIDSGWGAASFHVAGRPNHGEENDVLERQVSSGYFTTLQARLLRGRHFRGDEDASKPLVAIVNRALANKYFPGEDPIGKQIYYDWKPKELIEIVGLIDDIKEGPLEGTSLPALYVPYNQNPCPWPAVLVRSSQPEGSLFPEIAQAIHAVDPFISVSGERTMAERITSSPVAYFHESSAVLVGLFAAVALLLSVVGLYGVVAYSVSRRTHEIGIRMALGAERGAVYRLIMMEAGRLTVFGVLLGLMGSFGAATLLRSLLFGVRSWDVPTLAVVAAMLGLSALLASYLPARRAAAVNPVDALHTE
jgi:macrolide transport system ATP-binding/permease protein